MDDEFSHLLDEFQRASQPAYRDSGFVYDSSLSQSRHQALPGHEHYSPSSSYLMHQDLTPQPVTHGHPRRHRSIPQEPNTAASRAPISTNALPDRARSIFPFKTFNAIQSRSFQTLYHTDDNFALSAPTGSGKTVVFELAIIRAIQKHPAGAFKVVYMAPIKALCSERSRDWKSKFQALNLRVEEVTGDSDSASLNAVRDADIIVTTPEKWDSMTRKWKDHEKLVRMIRLPLIDEVHILGKDRGPTLEAVVSRMKSMESEIRLIALSATIPNCRDIAAWLGRSSFHPHVPAQCEEFGEEFRPVKLKRYVIGYDLSANDFQLDAYLGKQLPSVIQSYSAGKPILVFCGTRKSCSTTAKLLARWFQAERNRYWVAPRTNVTFHEELLTETAKHGVAFHHAGIAPQDRQKVEQMFINGDLGVICCTSTLAVGVNLPCHLVIVKGTTGFENGSPCELSDLEILQMLGRAGRPQYDDDAVAVIMTRKSRELAFRRMVECSQVVESQLHLNLIEHLNAEIGLGTIRNASDAVKWLSGTFLQVRLRANPDHYRKKECQLSASLDRSLESICEEALELLRCHDLIHPDANLRQTAAGAAMARYYIDFETMKGVVGLEAKPKISELLSTICASNELRQIHMRAKDRGVFKIVNQASSIRFPIKVDLAQGHQKVSLVIQSVLGGVDILASDPGYKSQFGIEQQVIFQYARRLIRCIVDCQVATGDAVGIRNSLMLVRSLGAQVWDDSPLALQQVPTIGPVGARKLINADITSIDALLEATPSRIETILSRQHPHGLKLIKYASEVPRLRVSLSRDGSPFVRPKDGVMVNIKIEIGFLNDYVPTKFAGQEVYMYFLAETSDGRKVDFGRISASKVQLNLVKRCTATLTAPGQWINCSVACEEIAGTQQSASLDPKISANLFANLDLPETAREQLSRPKTPLQSIVARKRSSNDTETQEIDWDDEVLADADFAAVEVASTAAVDVVNCRDGATSQPRPSETKRQTKKPTPEPERLPNGNWKCNHACNNRSKCGHKCCTHGMESKPRKKTRAKTTKNNEGNQDAKPSTADGKRETKLNPAKLSRMVTSNHLQNDVEVLDLSAGEQCASEPPAKRQRLSSISHNAHSAKATATMGNEEDEFEGFDDLDDIPALELLLEQEYSAPQPTLGTSEQSTNFHPQAQGHLSNDNPEKADGRAESEEHWLEAALIGAEDSFILSSPIRNNMRLDGGSSPSSYEIANTSGEGSATTDNTLKLDAASGIPRAAGKDDAAELEGLRTFVRELFGDLVELI